MPNTGMYAKGIAKRKEILAAGLRVFDREGNNGTTMRSVATEASLSLAGLMHYFPTRDELLTEMLISVDRGFEEMYWQRREELDPGELIAEWVDHYRTDSVHLMLYMTLIAATIANPNHPAVEWFRNRSKVFVAVVAQNVREQQARGEVSDRVDPEFVGRSLLAAADGIEIQWLYDDAVDMGAHIRHTWRMLMDRDQAP